LHPLIALQSVKNKTRIRLINVYFGKWPSYFNIFLHSCQLNPSVSFLFISDNSRPLEAPPNTHFISLTLSEFNALATRCLGFNTHITEAYKVCDLKPAFGLLFKDELTEFDFWGHIDIDLVLGNIRHFLTDSLLSGLDVLSAKKEYLVGHFTLYRNTLSVNTLYQNSKDYRLVFMSEEYHCFDECSFLWFDLLKGHSIDALDTAIESMTHVVKQLESHGKLRTHFQTVMEEQDTVDANGNLVEWKNEIHWNQGKLTTMSGRELMYFHFHFLKHTAGFQFPAWERIPASFKITNKGFTSSIQVDKKMPPSI
jgi:Family of unknown function (DUF6625)